jgi:XapX domain-containing protein
MLKIITGLALGFLIRAGCRLFAVPAPSPPKLVGLLVVAMTLGHLATDTFLARNVNVLGRRQATTLKYCGGPTGETTPERDARRQLTIEGT